MKALYLRAVQGDQFAETALGHLVKAIVVAADDVFKYVILDRNQSTAMSPATTTFFSGCTPAVT